MIYALGYRDNDKALQILQKIKLELGNIVSEELQTIMVLEKTVDNSITQPQKLMVAQGDILNNYSILQNFPNPFNPVTTIRYHIPQETFVSLKVYDILGKEVTTLKNEYQSPGTYSVSFDGSSYTSGVYFYTLKAGSFTKTSKFVLQK